MKTILRKQFQELVKDKSLYFWMLGLPIAFTVVFAAMFSGDKTAVAQIIPGYMITFVFFIIISMVQGFFADKGSGMLTRLLSTPMKSIDYLLGMLGSYFVLVVIQSAALLLFGVVVYGLNLGDLFAVFVLVAFLAACATGFGLVIALFVPSENMGIGLTQLISMGGAIVAGLWFPWEMLPKFMQTAGIFTPQYWARVGFNKIMDGAHVWHIWPSLLILLGFGAVTLGIGLWRFRRFVRDAAN